MGRLFLVRHGKAAAAFDAHADPGLDELGASQARLFAEDFAARRAAGRPPGAPLPILASPLQRTRETATPLAGLWQMPVVLEPRVAELPSLAGLPLAHRGIWIRELLRGEWQATEPGLQAWRAAVLAALLDLPGDTVVFTHFIAINVAVGAATGTDRILVTQPDHCSCTELEARGARLRLLATGRQLATEIL